MELKKCPNILLTGPKEAPREIDVIFKKKSNF